MKTTNVREEEETAVVAVEQDTVTPESTKKADQGALRIGLNNKFILLKFDRYFLKFLLIFFLRLAVHCIIVGWKFSIGLIYTCQLFQMFLK